MDKRELLNKAAQNDDERLLLGQVWDRCEQCRNRNIATHTAFLSPAEAEAARRLLRAMGAAEDYCFWGGYEGAERCQLHFLPDYLDGPEETAICALRCSWYPGDTVTHRDLLGSLMGLGIVRDTIGDILAGEDCHADVLVADAMAPYLLENWQSAGRTRLQLQRVSLHDLHLPQKQCREARDTVSSLRLDSVLAAGFSLSRGRAAEAVSGGKVQVNWTDCLRGDKILQQGDVITLRGAGKMELSTVGGTTKKGRISIVIRRYI